MAAKRRHTWVCGHSATGECSQCFAILRRKATALMEIIDDALEALRDNSDSGGVADRLGKRVTEVLHSDSGHPISLTATHHKETR